MSTGTIFNGVSGTKERLCTGLRYMEKGKFKKAIKNFEAAVAIGDGTNLERDAAAWWMVNAAKYRREWKKRQYGNANLFQYDPEDNSGRAWSDVDIAAVLLTPTSRKLDTYLTKFLGRSSEAIRFQRRYAYGQPLKSWLGESGKRYTRFTQTKDVKCRIGA